MKPIILPKEIKFNVIKTAKGKIGTIDSITIKKQPKTGPQIPSKFIISKIYSSIFENTPNSITNFLT